MSSLHSIYITHSNSVSSICSTVYEPKRIRRKYEYLSLGSSDVPHSKELLKVEAPRKKLAVIGFAKCLVSRSKKSAQSEQQECNVCKVQSAMRQVPLERDINIAVNGCSGFATSTQKEPFMAMLILRSRGT